MDCPVVLLESPNAKREVEPSTIKITDTVTTDFHDDYMLFSGPVVAPDSVPPTPDEEMEAANEYDRSGLSGSPEWEEEQPKNDHEDDEYDDEYDDGYDEYDDGADGVMMLRATYGRSCRAGA